MQILKLSSLFELGQAFPTEQSCIEYLEEIRWHGTVVSPFDPSSKVYKCSGGRYRCKNTKKYFTVKSESIFSGTHIPLQKWFMAIYLFYCHKRGISSYQLAIDIGVSQKTAWFMLHRLRQGGASQGFWNTEGVVEMDETMIGGKRKNKHLNKKSFDWKQDKEIVFGIVQRGGKVKMFHVPDREQSTIQPLIFKSIQEGCRIVTDEGTAYADLHKYYQHDQIIHSKHEYVRGEVFTNTIENVWTSVKNTIRGTYYRISKKYLQRYVDEFSTRYNVRELSTPHRFYYVIRGLFVPRITYKRLIAPN